METEIGEATRIMKYQVTFEDITEVLTEDQLIEFVKTAVVRNKDISSFKVTRIK